MTYKATVTLAHPAEADPYHDVPAFAQHLHWPSGMRIPAVGETVTWRWTAEEEPREFHVHYVSHHPLGTEARPEQPFTYIVLRQWCRGGHR